MFHRLIQTRGAIEVAALTGGRAPLVALTALAALLRFPTLDAKSFWEDEAKTVLLLDQGLGGVLTAIPSEEANPPLYYVIEWGWTRLFALGEVATRSISALVGTALVVVVYLAAMELASRRVALIGAALVAVNPLLVWFSQEARAYALLAFFGGLSFLFFARALNRRRRALVWWSVTSALALATHYFAVFLIAAEALWLVRALIPRRELALALAPVLAVAAALAPLALAQSRSGLGGWIDEIPLTSRVVELPGIYLVGLEAPSPKVIAAVAAVIALVGIWLLAAKSDARDRRTALVAGRVALGGISLALAFAIVGADYFIYKNLVAFSIPTTIFLAAGFGARRAGVAGPAAGVTLCALSIAIVAVTVSEPKFHREDWRTAAETLGAPSGDRAIVLTPDSGREPLEVYLGARVMPTNGASVREIVILGAARRALGAIEEPRVPRPSSTPAPAPGFHLVERQDADKYTLLRFRSAQPVVVVPQDLEPRRIDDTAAAVLLETPDER